MKSAVSCAVKALVLATPISGPALVVMVPCGGARDGGADDVADGEGFGAFADELLLGGDGVGGLAGLGDEEAEHAGVGNGVAVAVLAGVVDVHGQAGEPLDHELAGQAGVPAGPTRGNRYSRCRPELLGGDLHVGQEDLAGFEAKRGRGWCRGWRAAAR